MIEQLAASLGELFDQQKVFKSYLFGPLLGVEKKQGFLVLLVFILKLLGAQDTLLKCDINTRLSVVLRKYMAIVVMISQL